MRIGYLKVVSK